MSRKRNVVKVGNVRIPWRKFGDGRTCIDLRSLGLKRQTFTDHAAAIATAERLARECHNNGVDLRPITDEERGLLLRLLEVAKNLTVHASAVINAGAASLAKPTHAVSGIVAELLASKQLHDLNKRYRRGLTTDLQGFAKTFPGDIAAVEPRHIEDFLASFPAHGISRRNAARDNICALFNFARRRNYLPSDKTSAAQQVETIETPSAPVEFYAVWEMESYLAHVRPAFVPWLACNAFSGARHEEIVLARDAAAKKDPIRWEDFDWADRAIAVRPETSKTGRARRIPILDNLFDILRPWRDRKASGPICTVYPGDYETRRMVTQANKELEARKDIRRVAWRKNGLRHSYGSYRMAILQNEHQLAYEMGNSIEMIREHYHNPRPKSEAAAWFQLRRETPGNIIQIELFNAAA